MSLELHDERIVEAYTDSCCDYWTYGQRLQRFTEYLFNHSNCLEDSDCTYDISVAVDGLLRVDQDVALGEPEFVVFIPLDNEQGSVVQATQKPSEIIWFICDYEEAKGGYTYTQEQVDEIRKMLPYIKTKLVVN